MLKSDVIRFVWCQRSRSTCATQERGTIHGRYPTQYPSSWRLVVSLLSLCVFLTLSLFSCPLRQPRIEQEPLPKTRAPTLLLGSFLSLSSPSPAVELASALLLQRRVWIFHTGAQDAGIETQVCVEPCVPSGKLLALFKLSNHPFSPRNCPRDVTDTSSRPPS